MHSACVQARDRPQQECTEGSALQVLHYFIVLHIAIWPHAPTQKIIVTSFLSKVSERKIKSMCREVGESKLPGSRSDMADL